MVYIKRLELSHFKSFGGTTQIPLLPGFTVVSGPNGSGKSNILDALLFCLGLASSKGMRAERLPDLVNHNQPHRGTVEASVTVTFDLEKDVAADLVTDVTDNLGELTLGEVDGSIVTDKTDDLSMPQTENTSATVGKKSLAKSIEWSVTRKLRVTKSGTYTSNYYINGESCNLAELHEQLNELRIYPEGYNVVLQGDVTSIISMNSKERREIIDELAGVAAFDRKIVQTKATLAEVKEREDSCRIVEKELALQRDRLSQDRIKAEKYRKLRAELHEKEVWEIVLKWRSLQQQHQKLVEQLATGDRTESSLNQQLNSLNAEIVQLSGELEQLNLRVKALGEEELISLQSTLATQEAERRQLQRQQQELITSSQDTQKRLQETQQEIYQHQQNLKNLSLEKQTLENQDLDSLRILRNEAEQILAQNREQANAIAAASEAWVQQQTALNKQIDTLLKTVDPNRKEQAQLQERYHQLGRQIEEQSQILQGLYAEITEKNRNLSDIQILYNNSLQPIQSLAESLSLAEQELQIQQETQTRVLKEQREKQRQLDKLEAQNQAQQEAQGTYSTQIITQSGLSGICGLVAQLGRVEPRYQLALETSAGARLGNLVVEDDGVAAAAIELLKQKRAGRMTFLPLNKIQPPRFSQTVALQYANGFIDYAVNLIECDPRYKNIFAYVFGNTVIFETLNAARGYLGQYRIVTLEGEVLETSGAMTGGSSNQRSSLHFGNAESAESAEVMALKSRLQDIEQILDRCLERISFLSTQTKTLAKDVTESRQQRRETQLQLEQLQKEIKTVTAQQEQVRSQLAKNSQEIAIVQSRLEILDAELPAQEAQLQQYRLALADLETSSATSEWQQIQATIKVQESQLNEREKALRTAEQRLTDLDNQQQRLQEKIQTSQRRIQEYEQQQLTVNSQQSTVNNQLLILTAEITDTQASLTRVEARLGDEKKQRDRVETQLKERQLKQQQLEWQLQKLQETQQSRREQLDILLPQLEAQQAELPDPIPDVPTLIQPDSEEMSEAIAFDSLTAQLEYLQKQMRNLQKRLQAMEPVNMLALEEYDRTQARLDELTEKLATIEAERTELLLRVETFTTLRLRAFKEAFDAVNENFQTIFAELSDGDGYLQLEDAEDPFAGGLNLVAHPKGKPVQRLASMSGGEKSLTALSFIFALQRYRPSPFYAFDEVDMFLDGANVERLSKMIKQQAQEAQFIVVSLRRPMISASQRTIGVTQARGAYTQVLGIKL